MTEPVMGPEGNTLTPIAHAIAVLKPMLEGMEDCSPVQKDPGRLDVPPSRRQKLTALYRERAAELEPHTLGALAGLVGGADGAGVRTQSYVRTQNNSPASKGGAAIGPAQSASQQQGLRVWPSSFGILTPLPSGNGGGVGLSQQRLYSVSDSEAQDSVLSLSDSEAQDWASPLESQDTDADEGLVFLDEQCSVDPPESSAQVLILLYI